MNKLKCKIFKTYICSFDLENQINEWLDENKYIYEIKVDKYSIYIFYHIENDDSSKS